MDVTKDLLNRYDRGEELTDSDLDTLLIFYTRLERDLRLLGEKFYIAWREVFSRLHIVESMTYHRTMTRTGDYSEAT